jgi:hypothetical protein
MGSPGKNFASLILLIFIVTTGNLHAKAKDFPDTPIIYQSTEEKTFVINTCSRDLNEFRKLVNYAAQLKPYGKVQINISTLADNSFYELPKQRSPWFQYACNNATPYKFFPDPKIAPFIPADFVAKNKQLLLAKAKILKENGMEAAFFGSDPDFLPEAFFEAYPELLGPRIDHPRRSNNKAFSVCVSVKETQDMYTSMMAEMLTNAPEIKTFYFKTNDAGSGFCWSDWLYSGPNGPTHCKNETAGERMQKFMSALQSGAAKAGTTLDVYLAEHMGTSNFSDREKTDIQNHLPKNCYYLNSPEHEMIYIGGDISSMYPVNSVPDIFSFLTSLKSIDRHKKQTVFINFRVFYDRANESPDTEKVLLSILTKYMATPGMNDANTLLQQLSEEWEGKKNAQNLSDAFIALHEAFAFKNASLGNISGINWNVAARMIDRPLVAAPQRLSNEEEAYFLPHIFNVSEEEARMDYMDIQGGRRTASLDTIKMYIDKIKLVYKALDAIDESAPQHAFIQKMATGLRIHASLMRSCGNFAAAQAIRESVASKLNGPIHRPDKEPTWMGDTALQEFNIVMRDELDNTQELINMLEHGGISSLSLAKDTAHEDCFLLGPNIIEQLKKKRKIMLDHWLDIQDYLTTPFK